MATVDVELWTRRQSSVVESNRYMFDKQVACDVTFLVVQESPTGPKEHRTMTPIGAHKYVLSSRSPVFCAMFAGHLAGNTRDVQIQDVPVDAFRELLRFLYYAEAQVSHENVMSLMQAAKKYLIYPLIRLCHDFVKQALTVEQVCVVLEHALASQDAELTTRCLQFIGENTDDVLASDTFMKLDETAVLMIMQLTEVSTREVVLFEACVAWAKRCIGQNELQITPEALRASLINIFPHIRFLTMTPEEFSTSVVPLGILSSDETCQVYQYLACPVKPFSGPMTTSRCSEIHRKIVVLSTDYESIQLSRFASIEKQVVEWHGSTNRSMTLHSLYFIAGDTTPDPDESRYLRLADARKYAEYIPKIENVKLTQFGDVTNVTFGFGISYSFESTNYKETVQISSKCVIMEGETVQFGSKKHGIACLDFGSNALAIHEGDFKLTYTFTLDKPGYGLYTKHTAVYVAPVKNLLYQCRGLKLSMICLQRGPLCGLAVSTCSETSKTK